MIGLFLYSCEKEEESKIYTNLGEMLKDIDEECAYQIYLKDSVDFQKWIDTLTVVLLVALHETNHMINARLSGVNTEIYIITNGTPYERFYKISKQNLSPEDAEEYYKAARQLKKKIMKGRQEGLHIIGEFSLENLVFKKLRKTGKFGKLISTITRLYDKIYSQ